MPKSKNRQRNSREYPEPIPDSPKNIARAIMRKPPKKHWRYLVGHRREAK